MKLPPPSAVAAHRPRGRPRARAAAAPLGLAAPRGTHQAQTAGGGRQPAPRLERAFPTRAPARRGRPRPPRPAPAPADGRSAAWTTSISVTRSARPSRRSRSERASWSSVTSRVNARVYSSGASTGFIRCSLPLSSAIRRLVAISCSRAITALMYPASPSPADRSGSTASSVTRPARPPAALRGHGVEPCRPGHGRRAAPPAACTARRPPRTPGSVNACSGGVVAGPAIAGTCSAALSASRWTARRRRPAPLGPRTAAAAPLAGPPRVSRRDPPHHLALVVPSRPARPAGGRTRRAAPRA